MSKVGIKALRGLAGLESSLKALVEELLETKSRTKRDAALKSLTHVIAQSLAALPASEPAFRPVRVSLVALQNNVKGLVNGVEQELLTRSDFIRQLGTTQKTFIPKFRHALDEATAKIEEGASAYDEKGLLTSETVIQRELQTVQRDYKTLISKIESWAKKGESYIPQLIQSAISCRELVGATYGSMPSGKMLDDAATALLGMAGSLDTLIEYAQKKNRVSDQALRNLKMREPELERAMREIHRMVVNNLMQFDSEPRKSINLVLKKKKMEGELAPGNKEEIARSPDEFIRGEMAEIKGQHVALPSKIKGPYSAFRAPVVPIFETTDNAEGMRATGRIGVKPNFSKTELLDQFGIKYLQLPNFDYVLLRDQRILAVDRVAATEAILAANTRRRKTPNESELVAYANQVIAHLNENGSQRLSLVSQTYVANPKNTDMLLFWVMPSRILDALIKRGWNKLQVWNFPFSNSQLVLDSRG